jgi:glycosyltransferase involved in cell wall biosynthesis
MQHEVPVVWTFHEGEISGDSSDARREQPIKHIAYSRRLKRYAARRVDKVIVVAEHLREPLGRDDAVWIPAGVDMDVFAPMDSQRAKAEAGLDPNRRYVLFPSSPRRVEKRYELAKAAVDTLRREAGYDDVDLAVLDDIPHARVPLFINASEVMLMTSSFEASPVTIREALACNVPVLCTDVGDARTVLDGIAGCAVVPADADAIAAALRTSLSGPRRIAGREKMQAYSLSHGVEQLQKIYASLAAKQERSPA